MFRTLAAGLGTALLPFAPAPAPESPAPVPAIAAPAPGIPVSAAENPSAALQIPAPAPEIPVSTLENPATATENPASAPENPAAATENPATATEIPASAPENPAVAPEIPGHALVGYLHASFANGSGYTRIADVPAEWDVIDLAFAEPTSPTSGQLEFELCPVAECPNVETEEEFKAGIKQKQAEGKKVVLSVGGANGQVRLETPAARDAFVSSAGAIIDRYGLDGLDVDFEGHSLELAPGDTDLKNPTTPVVVNLIEALRALNAKYGERFVLTMAPETFFVQVGYQHYGGGTGADPRAGAYLPVIEALRDDLDLLHVQNYNSGPVMGLDDQYHTMGTADFHIAMIDMLLTGFPLAGNPDNTFAPLRPEQVAIGLPAANPAGNGFTPVPEVHKALDCLRSGTGCGPYQPHGTYPGLRGLMAWSINWDVYHGNEFARSHDGHS
ncbi:chitinase [Saccharopolyspora taberi]